MPRRRRRSSERHDISDARELKADVPETLAHGGQKLPDPAAAGMRFDLSDPDTAPPEEPGVSIEAMEAGVQFLRDATEQYNFESELRPEADHPMAGVPVAQVISDATLEAANQAEFALPISGALMDDAPELTGEPEPSTVDVTSRAIVGASLFDQPVAPLDAEQEERAAEEDFAAVVAAPLREAHFASDDPSDVDDERQLEIQRQLDERVKKRLRVDSLPKDRAGS